jgi:hypothetical protein
MRVRADERYGVEKVLAFYRQWETAQRVPDAFAFPALRGDARGSGGIGLRLTLGFLGARDVPDRVIADAVDFSRFENLRRAEARTASAATCCARRRERRSRVVQGAQGQVGGFREYLSNDDVRVHRRRRIRARLRVSPGVRHEPIPPTRRRRRRRPSACSSAPISTFRRTTPWAVTDDTRIRASLPGIRDALARGGAVMVTSHLGRPTEGVLRDEDSLAPIAERMAELLGREVPLIRDWVDGGPWHAKLGPATSCCSRTAASTRARRRTTKDSRAAWRRCATSTSTTRSAPRIAPRRRRTASRNTRGSRARGP